MFIGQIVAEHDGGRSLERLLLHEGGDGCALVGARRLQLQHHMARLQRQACLGLQLPGQSLRRRALVGRQSIMQARRDSLVLDDHSLPVSGEGVKGVQSPGDGGVGRRPLDRAAFQAPLQSMNARGGFKGPVGDPVDLSDGAAADHGDPAVEAILHRLQHGRAARHGTDLVRRRRHGRKHAVQVEEQGDSLGGDRRSGQQQIGGSGVRRHRYLTLYGFPRPP